MADVRRIAVIGAGTMGSGIAQACAQSGFQVTMHDVKPELVKKGLDRIADQLQKRVDKGKLERAERDAILGRITTTTSLAEAGRDADLIIEAVFEEMKVKEDVFKQLAAAAPAHAVFATNTSSLSVNQLARVTQRPDRFGGLHFFNPAAVNLLLEAIRGDATGEAAWGTLLKVGAALGKTTIVVKDSPGFCVNRFFVPFLNEACRLHEEGFAIPTVDAAAKEAFGISMGPFELMNFTGIPIAYHAQASLAQLGPFYAPAASLRKQFESGKPWDLQGSVEPGQLQAARERLQGVCFGVAAQLVEEGVASVGDTDKGAAVGLRWAKGPFALMNDLGPREALQLVEGVAKKHPSFRVAAPLRDHAAREQPWHIPRVRLERHGAVAVIAVDRPEALNALNRDVLRDLIAAVDEVERDPAIHCVVLTGAGRAFIAGADIGIMAEVSALESREYTKLGQRAARKLERLEKPVIAAVNGFALGGGTEMALACDIILASDKATFGLPEVTLGIHPGFGGTQRLPRLIGKHLAKELIFTGQTISADRAEALGIVNRVVAHDRLFDEAMALAQRIAANAPVAVRLSKTAVNRGVEVDLDTALGMEVESVTITFATEDRLEGMRAFLEKRKPEFKGK